MGTREKKTSEKGETLKKKIDHKYEPEMQRGRGGMMKKLIGRYLAST